MQDQQQVNRENAAKAAVKKERPPAPQFKELKIGDITKVFGIPCMLANVNPGKRRLTLVPMNPGTGVPVTVTQRSRPAAPLKKGK